MDTELKSSFSGWLERNPMFQLDLGGFLQGRYFNVRVQGLENVPATGSALLIANRSGWLPLDAAMLLQSLRPLGRETVAFIEPGWIQGATQALFGNLTLRTGGPEEAYRELSQRKLVVIFPEGPASLKKNFWRSEKLAPFGRGGFLRIALETESALLPVAIRGGQNAFPVLAHTPELHLGPLHVPSVPLTPLFPWFGLLGLIPLPAAWSIHIGEALPAPRSPRSTANDDWALEEMLGDLRRRIEGLLSSAQEPEKSSL